MHFVTSILGKVIVLMVDTFRWAGILSILFLIECICIFFYCENKIGIANISREPILITNISCNEAINSKGEKGYEFTLTLQNNGSKKALIGGNLAYNDELYSINSESGYIYYDVYSWGELYDGAVVPPGTETVTTVFIRSETLEAEDTENIHFCLEWKEIAASFPIEDLP